MRCISAALAGLTLLTGLLPYFVLHHRLPVISLALEEAWQRPLTEVLQSSQNAAPWTLFYHVYFPPDNDEGYQHAAAIVEEQLTMIGESYATSLAYSPPVLYYTVIGSPLRNPTWMDDLCERNRLTCILLQHVTEGQEDVSLQALYNFCRAVPSQSVVYLHSKGSFHASGPKFATQDVWRQRLTQAATHRLCLEATSSRNKETCETCSLLLQPLPGIHYPGNMWTARCTHVRRLLPPTSFAMRMDEVVQAYKVLRDRGRLNTTFFPQMPHMMGRKRFAAEHWLGSHPALRHPCDLSADVTANLSEWLHSPSLSANDFALSSSPYFPIDNEHWDYFRYGKRGSQVLTTPSLRYRDYFLLPGQLLKWYTLYQVAPPADSWIWMWFPDADLWRRKINDLGVAFWKEDGDDWFPPPVAMEG
jgi:hypothetical protein